MQAQLFHQHVTCKHISSIIVVNRMSRPQQNEGSHRPLRDNALLCNHLSTRALRPANRRDAGRLSLLPRTPPEHQSPAKRQNKPAELRRALQTLPAHTASQGTQSHVELRTAPQSSTAPILPRSEASRLRHPVAQAIRRLATNGQLLDN